MALMTWKEKFILLQALNPDVSLRARSVSKWFVVVPGTERKEGIFLRAGGAVDYLTPEAAVDNYWSWATDPRYVMVINAMVPDQRRELRWTGHVWIAA